MNKILAAQHPHPHLPHISLWRCSSHIHHSVWFCSKLKEKDTLPWLHGELGTQLFQPLCLGDFLNEAAQAVTAWFKIVDNEIKVIVEESTWLNLCVRSEISYILSLQGKREKRESIAHHLWKWFVVHSPDSETLTHCQEHLHSSCAPRSLLNPISLPPPYFKTVLCTHTFAKYCMDSAFSLGKDLLMPRPSNSNWQWPNLDTSLLAQYILACAPSLRLSFGGFWVMQTSCHLLEKNWLWCS